MSDTQPFESLRERLFDYATAAREARIAKDDAGYKTARAEVEQTLALLRERYKQDASLFGSGLLADIRACKICAGIITREDLDQEAEERAYEAYVRELTTRHLSFLSRKGVSSIGVRVAPNRHRETHCYCGRAWLDNRVHMECNRCGGIICFVCGGCFC
jgi:hypothetical protein